jgi:2-polyprenyl-3-methyl-5-hydroxy-6-metoxy-1,4-benzoquinol methylase
MTNTTAPSPKLFFDTVNAYQRTAAIKAAIELDVFTAIGDTPATAAEIAERCNASERGTRILCDYLTMLGFLTKSGDWYALTSDSALFLNRASPAYAGGITKFLLAPELTRGFEDVAGAVRKGGTIRSELGTLAPEHPVWLEFARGMAPLMTQPAQIVADLIPLDGSRPTKVLDISASHGMWGIAFAQRNPQTHVVAVDWAPVLEISRQNAQRAGVAERFSTIAGSAFEVDFGSDYDVVLVPNFLHHFNMEDCIRFLKKVHGALRNEGCVAISELVPNEDRVTPPEAARFSFVMLATTPEGDAYTLTELEKMLTRAGFKAPEHHPLPPFATAIIARK